MCWGGLLRISSQWQSIEESLCDSFCVEIASLEVYHLAHGAGCVFCALGAQSLIILEVLSIDPIDLAESCVQRELIWWQFGGQHTATEDACLQQVLINLVSW